MLSYRKFLVYALGILILTLGIALTIQSDMGTSPFDALLVGLYETVGFTIGSWEIVIGLSMVLFNAAAQWKKPEYIALLTAFITGLGIDFWVFVLQGWIQPHTIISQSFCLGMGMVIAGLGIAIYLQADFAPIPMDRMMLVISKMTGLNISLSRTLINGCLVILAFVFHGPIGIGTLLSVILSGPIIHFFMYYLKQKAAVSPKEVMNEGM